MVSQVLQANINPYLFFDWAPLPELESNLRWLLLMVGLGIPRQSQAVNPGWPLLVPGLGLTEASCCLFERI